MKTAKQLSIWFLMIIAGLIVCAFWFVFAWYAAGLVLIIWIYLLFRKN
jgi:hypothetical protein